MAGNFKRTEVLSADEIERLRLARGWTVDTLANRAGVTARTLRRKLAGQPAYLETIMQIANAFHVQPESLIAKNGQPIDQARTTPEIAYELQLRVTGCIDSNDKAARLMELPHDMLGQLRQLGIEVDTHHINLELTDQSAEEEDSWLVRFAGHCYGQTHYLFFEIKPKMLTTFLEMTDRGKLDLNNFGSIGWVRGPLEEAGMHDSPRSAAEVFAAMERPHAIAVPAGRVLQRTIDTWCNWNPVRGTRQ